MPGTCFSGPGIPGIGRERNYYVPAAGCLLPQNISGMWIQALSFRCLPKNLQSQQSRQERGSIFDPQGPVPHGLWLTSSHHCHNWNQRALRLDPGSRIYEYAAPCLSPLLFPFFALKHSAASLGDRDSLVYPFFVRQAAPNTLRTGNYAGTVTAPLLRTVTSLFQARPPAKFPICEPETAVSRGRLGSAAPRRGMSMPEASPAFPRVNQIAPDSFATRVSAVPSRAFWWRANQRTRNSPPPPPLLGMVAPHQSLCRGSHHLITSPTLGPCCETAGSAPAARTGRVLFVAAALPTAASSSFSTHLKRWDC